MKKVAISLLTMLFGAVCYADNPIVQTLYTADPAPMVHDGVCYVYTSHDEDVLVRNFFTMNDWRCYSTTDMVNWTDLGSPLSYKSFSWARGDAWAGQVIFRNGKFYYYVPMNRKNAGMAIGVAVSDKPEGPFTDPLDKPLVFAGNGDIDPTVFIDDDGQAYLYWGNPQPYYVKLNEDMISYSGEIVKVPLTVESFGKRSKDDRPTTYEEGPWLYKRSGLYYLVFAAGPISEHIGYSTSASPTGPWQYRGVVMPTQGGSFTNHPGLCEYKGNSYFFYHNGALPDGGGFHRSVCVEQFKYNADGTIPTLKMTKEGASQIGSLDPYQTVQAETICWATGVETEKCEEGGMNVCDISNGDNIRVKGVDFAAGAKSFSARVASEVAGGKIEIRLDNATGKVVGTCEVPATGGQQKWQTVSCPITEATGKHDLYFVFAAGEGNKFSFNWWKFEK